MYCSLSLWPNAFGPNAVLGPNTAIVQHGHRAALGLGMEFRFRPKILVPFSGQFHLQPKTIKAFSVGL